MGNSYKIHRMLLTKTAKEIRKVKKEYRKLTDEQCIGLITEDNKGFSNTLDFSIMSQESHWKSGDCNIVFPDGAEMIDKLLNAKFDMEVGVGFEMPFDSFIFGMPHGYMIDGQEIPSFIVTCMSNDELQEHSINEFVKKCGLKKLDIKRSDRSKGLKMLTVSYRDPFSECYVTLMRYVDEIPSVLKSKTPEEFRSLVQLTMEKNNVIDLTEEDIKLQLNIFKLVAALGVYHVSTEGEKLKAGFPKTGPFKLQGLKDISASYSSYSMPKGNSPSEHLRNWTFRQLRDPRYYRGEHKHKEPGSRWVFVDACTVGTKSSPFTQE